MNPLLRAAEDAGLEGAILSSGGAAASDARVDGRFGGRPVGLIRERSGDALFYAVEAPLDPPLDLGLEMRPSSLARQPTASGIGHIHLDQEYVLSVDEPRRARALFDATFADRVYELHCGCASPIIEDNRVRIVGEWSRQSVVGVTEIANLVDAARERIPPCGSLAAHVPVWTVLAERFGAQLLHTPLRVSGTFERLGLEVTAGRIGRLRYRLCLALRLPEALGAALRITPTRTLVDTVGVLFGGQDVRVGDGAFDDAYRIRVAAEHEAALIRALDQGTRALLLGARERGAELSLDDQGLTAIFPADADVQALSSAVEPLADATRRIERALRLGGKPASPYRG